MEVIYCTLAYITFQNGSWQGPVGSSCSVPASDPWKGLLTAEVNIWPLDICICIYLFVGTLLGNIESADYHWICSQHTSTIVPISHMMLELNAHVHCSIRHTTYWYFTPRCKMLMYGNAGLNHVNVHICS